MLLTMKKKHIYVMLYKHKYFKLKEYVVINIYMYLVSFQMQVHFSKLNNDLYST